MVPIATLILIVALTLTIAALVIGGSKNLLAWAVLLLCIVHLWRG